MPISAKVDEDLPAEIAGVLQSAGHQVATVVGQGLGGATDERVYSVAVNERRMLFTSDKGLASARDHPPGSHAGIVLFRLRRESRAGYIELCKLLLREVALDAVIGAIVVVEPDGVRIRRP